MGDGQGRPLPSECRQHTGSPACSPAQGSTGGIQEPIWGPAAPPALGQPHVPAPRALCPQRSGSKHASTPADNYYLARRRTLQVVVSSLLTEAGFESAEKAAVETLTEMLQSCECLAASLRAPEASCFSIFKLAFTPSFFFFPISLVLC